MSCRWHQVICEHGARMSRFRVWIDIVALVAGGAFLIYLLLDFIQYQMEAL